jgi:hypothetical protein
MCNCVGARCNLVVKALDYKPEGREFETQWGEIWYLPNPSGRSRPLTEMSNGNIKKMFLGSKVWPVRGAENLTAICLDNVGSLTSHNPIGLHGLLRG